jgi:hypothetical protein
LKQWCDYWVTFFAWAFQWVFGAAMFWQLWLAFPFIMGGYHRPAFAHLAFALGMWLCGCFANNDWHYRQQYYLETYHPGETWEE